jgi:TatA/E family protein of Tat protein translocase
MGMTELLVILAVALLVLGPKRLPELASGLGKAIREFRKATRDLTDQIEVDESVRKPIAELKAALRDEPSPSVAAKPPEGTIAAAPADGPPASLGAIDEKAIAAATPVAVSDEKKPAAETPAADPIPTKA